MPPTPIVNLDAAFAAITECWRPRIAAEPNGQHVKLARLEGRFVWHRHDVDEMFLVWKGRLRLELRDRVVAMGPGDLFVVPRGVEHRPVAEGEAEVLLFEPATTRRTGDVHVEGSEGP